MKKFYSNGKLLITGEYIVLDGAIALALPTKFGQDLVVIEKQNQLISWKSFDFDDSCWFDAAITFNEIIHKNSFGEYCTIKNTLLQILHQAHKLNPSIILNSQGFQVTTTLTFPRNWGLGTSSTLINNIAQWFRVDAFVLLKNSFGGSGYDIACAQNNTPILYQLRNEIPIVTTISFHPKFTKHIYFVYLNQKQNSKTAILNYQKNTFDKEKISDKINQLTKIIATTTDFLVFENAIKQHENELSLVLNQPTIKQQLFSDFEGAVKSLGAWGGDFVMVLSKENPKNYFELKGYTTILSFTNMIL